MSFEPIFTFLEEHGGKFKYQCNLCPDKQTINSFRTTNKQFIRHLKSKHSKEDQEKLTVILKKNRKKTMKMEKPPKNEIFEIEKLVDPTNEKLIKKIQALEEIFSSVKEDIAKHKISPEFLQMYYVYQIDYLESCLKDIIDDSSEFDKVKIQGILPLIREHIHYEKNDKFFEEDSAHGMFLECTLEYHQKSSHMFIRPPEFSGNHGNYQTFVPSLVFHKL